MAFLYPSLMALTVNRADDRERPAAISSFTMFFEIGTVTGGLAARPRRRARSASGRRSPRRLVVLVFGLWLLRTKVVPAPRRVRVFTTGEVALIPAAGD